MSESYNSLSNLQRREKKRGRSNNNNNNRQIREELLAKVKRALDRAPRTELPSAQPMNENELNNVFNTYTKSIELLDSLNKLKTKVEESMYKYNTNALNEIMKTGLTVRYKERPWKTRSVNSNGRRTETSHEFKGKIQSINSFNKTVNLQRLGSNIKETVPYESVKGINSLLGRLRRRESGLRR